MGCIERFSFKCRKTKTKTKTKTETMIGFGLASDLLSRWREFLKPITERSKAKPISDYFRYQETIVIYSHWDPLQTMPGL